MTKNFDIFDGPKNMERRGALFGLLNRFLDGNIDHKPIEEFINRECATVASESLERIKQKNVPEKREINPSYWLGVDDMNARVTAEQENYTLAAILRATSGQEGELKG